MQPPQRTIPFFTATLLLGLGCFPITAWSLSSPKPDLSRRQALLSTGAGAVAALVGGWAQHPPVAFAATSGPTADELARLQKGYAQITYLLDHWEEETTVCKENGGECKRDADAVRRALGLRSTTDPLFQAEKILEKVKYMNNDDLDLEAFFDATEDWNSAVNMSNSMAFISQFGEYNPGGGKDEVLKYLNESKKQVEQAQSALRTIIEALGIEAKS